MGLNEIGHLIANLRQLFSEIIFTNLAKNNFFNSVMTIPVVIAK